MPNRLKYHKMFLLTGAIFGLVSGILWFRIGEIFDSHIGNFTSWFIMPAILPLLITGAYLFRKYSRKTLIRGVVFVAVYYGFHWLPMLLTLLYFLLFNIKM
jgi:hypothetical protein